MRFVFVQHLCEIFRGLWKGTSYVFREMICLNACVAPLYAGVYPLAKKGTMLQDVHAKSEKIVQGLTCRGKDHAAGPSAREKRRG